MGQGLGCDWSEFGFRWVMLRLDLSELVFCCDGGRADRTRSQMHSEDNREDFVAVVYNAY